MSYYKKGLFKKCSHAWSHLTFLFVPSPSTTISRSILPQGLSINWAPWEKAYPPRFRHSWCHLSSYRSRFKCNKLPQILLGPTNLATVIHSLLHQPVLFLSQPFLGTATILVYSCVFVLRAQRLFLSGLVLYPQHLCCWHLQVQLAYLPN